ncbi:MAG: exodeoxyribonuclease III [Actinomycetota bacterium]|nr:exodeoxyribonuclease III [Actinomycetota bacterium]
MTRLATWNVNSLKVRQERVEAWITEVQPDIVCLQETKLSDSAFPAMSFAALGYDSAHYGEGRWNGVGILSRVGLDDIVADFADGGDPDTDARLLSATCAGIRISSVYVPNGRDPEHDHYQYKLRWLDRLAAHLVATTEISDPVVVAGDFNIAPGDDDVYDVTKFEGATHVSQPERDRLSALIHWGLRDIGREQVGTGSVFSWWDYRRGDFHEGRGMRIDLVLGTPSVADRVEWAIIDRNARKGKLPSDHAPVIIDLTD